MTTTPTAPHELPPCPHCKQVWHATSCLVIAPFPTGQRAERIAQAAIPTWQERMPEPRRAYTCDMNCSSDRRHNSPTSCGDCMPVVVRGDSVAARDAEIADLRAALAAQSQGARAAPTWGRVDTVADMVRNLLTLDQSEPIFSAFHIDFDGARRCRTSPISISQERVIDGKWIDSKRKDVPYATVMWARPDERADQQAAAPGVTLEEVLYALDLVVSEMDVPGLSGQRAFAADVLERAAQLDGSQGQGKRL